MNKEKKYCFYPKIHNFFGLLSLIIIPCFIFLLIFYFSILLLIGTILISSFVILLNVYFIKNGIEIYEDRLIYYGIKKNEIKKLNIKSIKLLDGYSILIKTENKNYRIPGYFDFLNKFPNSTKNKEFVQLLNNWLKKK